MADESFSGFFAECAKSPKQCALAAKNQTATQLESQFWDFLETVKYDPVRSGTEAIDYDMIKDLVVASLYGPRNWPTLATALSDLMNTNNATALLAYHQTISGTVSETTTQDANTGIECGDKDVARVLSREEFMPIVHKKYNISRTIADSLMFSDMACAQWKMHAKERYGGDFHVKTRTPLLFIGNTWDPMTPYQSAQNMSVGFSGSGLIEQKSYGVSPSTFKTLLKLCYTKSHMIACLIGTTLGLHYPRSS